MQNRRNFLLQSTLAAGAILFSKSVKTAAFSPVASSISTTEKLTILHLNTLQKEFQKVLLPPLSCRLPAYFKNGNCNTLLLSTQNITSPHAIVPNHSDHRNGFPAYKELTTDFEIMSLTEDNCHVNLEILPHHIVFKGKIKIGIIGNELRNSGGFKEDNLQKVATTLNNTANFLKANQACNFIVSMNPLYNATKIEEKELAMLTNNIDVILSSNSAHKTPLTYIARNALREEVVLNYQGVESLHLKGIDITFNDKYEKTNFALRRMV